MTDWRRIAQARGFNLPEPELARIAAVLDELDTVLAPLMREVPIETEPATVFRAAPEEEA
jgi:hypothetical protein